VVGVVDHLDAAAPDRPADVVVLELEGGAWVALRPSGTEPKLKVYAEVVHPATQGDLTATRAKAHKALERLHEAIGERLGFPDAGVALG
jgi:phosphomannomutase